MPLRLAALHPGHRAAVGEALARLRARGPHAPRFLRGHAPAALALALPHEAWDLTLEAVARGAGLAAARRTGVRHLVSGPGGTLAAAEVPEGADVAHVNEGPLVQATLEAARTAEALAAAQGRTWDVRLLRVAALHAVALWLHGEGDDRLIPLAPAPPEWVAGEPVAAEAALAALQARARDTAARGSRLHP